jgi:hypothetical protein
MNRNCVLEPQLLHVPGLHQLAFGDTGKCVVKLWDSPHVYLCKLIISTPGSLVPVEPSNSSQNVEY